jgi:3-deoxy-D-manno-octulosonic-acid transferase
METRDRRVARGLGLRAYLAYARGASTAWVAPRFEPARGPLLLACAQEAGARRALGTLCARLQQTRPEVTIVSPDPANPCPDTVHVPLPPDRVSDCEAFVAGLRPDAVLWAGQTLAPALLSSLKARGARLIALDAAEAAWETPAPRWLPDPSAATLALFDSIHCANAAAARRLRRLGVAPERVRVSGPLQDSALPLDCNEALHAEIAPLLAGRPVWLAARLRAAEATEVLRAHRRAVRLAHRLLLVIAPAGRTDHAAMAKALQADSMRVCHWDSGEMPDENTQVLLAEGPEELGLWYRVAPLAFLGGSLTQGHGGHDPFEAATLGAAVLYGPNVGQHLSAYGRLVEAGGARIVRDSDSLAAAVTHLVAPDQAAAMAHAGWDVISAGAALVDAVIAELGGVFDARGAA